MTSLLDIGLEALIAPREDGGGGAGLVLGALAAVAGLAVLGITAREKAAALLAGVPVARMSIQDCLWGKALAVGTMDDLRLRWNRPADFGQRGARTSLKGLVGEIGWAEPPQSEEERAVLIDALLEAEKPLGTAACSWATRTPMLWVSPDGQVAGLYSFEKVAGLDALSPHQRARAVADRAGCQPVAFNVNTGGLWHPSTLHVLGADASARDHRERVSWTTWRAEES